MNKLIGIGIVVLVFLILFFRAGKAAAAPASPGSPATGGSTGGAASPTGYGTSATASPTGAPTIPDFMGPASTFYNNLGYPGPFNGGEVQDGIIKEYVRIRDSAAPVKNKYDWVANLQVLAARFREQSGIQLIIEQVCQNYQDSIHAQAYPGWVAKNATQIGAGVGTFVGGLVGGPVGAAAGAKVGASAGTAAVK